MARTKLQVIDGQILEVWSSGNSSINRIYNSSGNLLLEASKVGINTTSPQYSFVVSASGALGIEIDTGTIFGNVVTMQVYDRVGATYRRLTSIASSFDWRPGGTLAWTIDATGILESNGAQTVRTSTGNLTLATAAGNGNIVLSNHGSGVVNVTSLTASRFVKTDASKNLTVSASSLIVLTSEVSGILPLVNGGLGLGGCSQGDIFYSHATDAVSALTKNTSATRYLSNTGSSNNPAWAQVNLTNGVTGTLPIANGGTNSISFGTSGGIVYYDGSKLTNEAGLVWDATNNELKITHSGGLTANKRFYVVSNDTIGDEWYLENRTGGASMALDGHASASWRLLAFTDKTFTIEERASNKYAILCSELGNVVVGLEGGVSTTATDGFLHIPVCAGTPTGTPTTYSGKVPMVYDSTNNKLYIYDSGWISVTLA